jgi:hypothetical protein
VAIAPTAQLTCELLDLQSTQITDDGLSRPTLMDVTVTRLSTSIIVQFFFKLTSLEAEMKISPRRSKNIAVKLFKSCAFEILTPSRSVRLKSDSNHENLFSSYFAESKSRWLN